MTTREKLDALRRTADEISFMVSEAERCFQDRDQGEYELAVNTADMLFDDLAKLLEDAKAAKPPAQLRLVR